MIPVVIVYVVVFFSLALLVHAARMFCRKQGIFLSIVDSSEMSLEVPICILFWPIALVVFPIYGLLMASAWALSSAAAYACRRIGWLPDE